MYNSRPVFFTIFVAETWSGALHKVLGEVIVALDNEVLGLSSIIQNRDG
jgi:hypothetical protein